MHESTNIYFSLATVAPVMLGTPDVAEVQTFILLYHLLSTVAALKTYGIDREARYDNFFVAHFLYAVVWSRLI